MQCRVKKVLLINECNECKTDNTNPGVASRLKSINIAIMMMMVVAMCVGGGCTILLPLACTWTQCFILSQTVVVYRTTNNSGQGMTEEMWKFYSFT